MSENTQIDELRREIRADRLIVLRCWMVYLTWACTFWVPEYRSIFNSMNIELPLATKALLGISGLLYGVAMRVAPVRALEPAGA